mgnify:FL=1
MFPKKMKKITCGVLGVKANIRAGYKNYGYILSVEGVYSLTDPTCRDLTVDRIWVNNTIAGLQHWPGMHFVQIVYLIGSMIASTGAISHAVLAISL